MFKYYDSKTGTVFGWRIARDSIILIVLLILFFGSFGNIDAGNVGVRTRFGAVVGTIQPGFYVKMPLIEHVTSMDVQTQKDQADASAASSDLQNVTATVAVNYHVEPQDAATIFQNIGYDYANRIISPAIAESVKSITANYTAEELITKRETVRQDILALLTTKLQVYGVKTDTLNIVNFNFSDQFNQAIEAKVTAQQNALAAQNKLAQVQFEAQQTVASAEAQAKAIQIQAAAINSQGGADYVQLQAIKQWDGHLPTSMIPGGAVPFLNLTK
jgi:regulator of protease activity HflC (stomatin/prohibitin superfamily)